MNLKNRLAKLEKSSTSSKEEDFRRECRQKVLERIRILFTEDPGKKERYFAWLERWNKAGCPALKKNSYWAEGFRDAVFRDSEN